MKLPGMTAWRGMTGGETLLDGLNRPELKVLRRDLIWRASDSAIGP